MAEFAITDLGPINKLTITAKPGHITVLKGPNGSGKSTALAAVSSVATGKKNSDLTTRDGAKNGSIAGAGITLKLTPSGTNKRTGELQCEPVDENLTIADIVDPGVKDPKAADRKRVAAACTLLQIEPNLDLFQECFEGTGITSSDVVSKNTLNADSIVGMAGGLKKDVFALALELEKEAIEVEAEIRTLKAGLEGLDLSAESDADVLDKIVEDAAAKKSALEERQRIAAENQVQLDDLPVLPPVEHLKAQLKETEEATEALLSQQVLYRERIATLEKQLAEAKEAAQKVERDIEAQDSLRDSITLKISNSTLREKLQQSVKDAPKPTDLTAAVEALTEAKRLRDNGVSIRKAKEQVAKIEAKEAELESKQDRASVARELGKKFQNRLANLLDGTGLSVNEEERLVVEHPVRGECLYSELSDGERWTKAIEIAVESANRREVENGLLLIPQPAWEGLDETNRRVIREAIAETDLAIITAEAHGEQGDNCVSEVL